MAHGWRRQGIRKPRRATRAWVRPLYKRGGRKLQLRPIEARIMLALFLDHSPLFVAGEIAIGLSLALFIGAFVAARAPDRILGGLIKDNQQMGFQLSRHQKTVPLRGATSVANCRR